MTDSPPKEEPSWLDKPITGVISRSATCPCHSEWGKPEGKCVAGSMLKAAVQLIAGRSTAVDTTKKIMDDFEKLMTSGDPSQATELLKPEVCSRCLDVFLMK